MDAFSRKWMCLSSVGTIWLFLLYLHMMLSKQPGSYRSTAYQAKVTSHVKLLFLANSFFGHRDWYFKIHGYCRNNLTQFKPRCPSNNKCIVSFNPADSSAADALLFHSRDHSPGYKNRRPEQIYIMYGWESPWYQGSDFIHGGHFYNWSATYHRKADIRLLSGLYFNKSHKDVDAIQKLPQFGSKRKNHSATIAWVVSNCNSGSNRMKYMEALRKYIPIDIYGSCGTKRCPKEIGRHNDISCHNAIGNTGQYKFYLAFENSACEDYISLKAFRAANSSMLPIVLGGKSMNDYKALLPPNSYLDVRNFTSPKKLAMYLKFLDENDDAYRAYHAWRANYWVRESGASHGFYDDGHKVYGGKKNHDLHWICTICDALHDPAKAKPRRNIDWDKYWARGRMCDPKLVQRKLKGSRGS